MIEVLCFFSASSLRVKITLNVVSGNLTLMVTFLVLDKIQAVLLSKTFSLETSGPFYITDQHSSS